MTTITWLGEDSAYPDGNGPRYNEWNGVRFKIGEPMDMDKVDVPRKAHMIEKARTNPFYEVSGDELQPEPVKRGPGRPPKPVEPEE